MVDIMQGDQYELEIQGTGFLVAEVAMIEFQIGTLKKNYPAQVRYNSTTDRFYFPLTQAETYALKGNVPGQVRVKFLDNTVIGADMDLLNIHRSISKVVL